MTAIVNVSNVTVQIGTARLLDDVSLSVRAGECVALVGPNGAGKSTLLRVLSGEIRPVAGAATLKGKPLPAYTSRELALQRAVLPQTVSVAFAFTVGEVVRMGAGDRHDAFADETVERALAQSGISHLRDRVIMTLSGGEQQRAHFARILVQLVCGEAERGPGLLLLDEPTSSLDLRHQLDLLTSVRDCAARGVAVIAVLHDLNLASRFAQRVIMLDRGRIARDGTAAETITDEMLLSVFNVRAAVNRAPEGDAPYVLPHRAH